MEIKKKAKAIEASYYEIYIFVVHSFGTFYGLKESV